MKDSTTSTPVENTTSLLGLVVALYWKAYGNLPVVFIPLMMIKDKTPAFSGRDILFAVSVVALIGMRLLDARLYDEPKPGEVKKYVIGLLVVSTVLLALGHGVAHLLA